MKRGVLRRSVVVGLVLTTATAIGGAGAGTAMADLSPPARAAAPGASTGGVVPDRYIVVLKDGKATPEATLASASSLTGAVGGSVRHVFTRAIRGFSVQMSDAQAKRLATNANVSYVQQVRTFSGTDVQSNPPSWGLDRIDQTTPVPSQSYTYSPGASAVTAYVIDSGINIAHQDFGNRARYGVDLVDNDAVADDCSGHGTHVAGTIGGATFGVAKNVNLVAVRVLNCAGSGTTENVVAGIDWVTANAVKPAVANLSLGSNGVDRVVDEAVRASITSGVTYAVAAGNAWRDACGVSPADVSTAITVGATDNTDFRAWFSNYGQCVDVFAPGVNITSAAIGTTTGSTTKDGTSMAAPHVAGAAALLLSANPTWTPQQVRDAIVTTATSGAIQDAKASPNRLLRIGSREPNRNNVGLRALINGLAVAPGTGVEQVIANQPTVRPEDRFDQVDAGDGYVALRSRATGLYMSADDSGNRPLITNGPAIGSWEKFQVIDNSDGSVSFRAFVNGLYVSADRAGAGPLITNGPAIKEWERFEYVAPPPVVAIRAQSNGLWVSVGDGGSAPLIAEGPRVKEWERYELSDAGNGYLALKSLNDGKYVSADRAGAGPLIANGPAVSSWERFYVEAYLPGGAVNLVFYVNGLAVTTPDGGASPLIASKQINAADPALGLGPSEQFYFVAVD